MDQNISAVLNTHRETIDSARNIGETRRIVRHGPRRLLHEDIDQGCP